MGNGGEGPCSISVNSPFCAALLLSDLGSASHRAGSPGDDVLANKVLTKFKAYSMEPWTDEHFVRVQEPNARKHNQVTFNGVAENQAGFLSYSATGNVTVSEVCLVWMLSDVVPYYEHTLYLRKVCLCF